MPKEIEEIMDDELTPIVRKEKMNILEVCENFEILLRNRYIEYTTRGLVFPSIYISALKLNPKRESDTTNRFKIGAFKIGKGDIEDLMINKDTGIPERMNRCLDSYYFLTIIEFGLIKTGEELLDTIFSITKEKLQYSKKEVELARTRTFTDKGIGLANMELTLLCSD